MKKLKILSILLIIFSLQTLWAQDQKASTKEIDLNVKLRSWDTEFVTVRGGYVDRMVVELRRCFLNSTPATIYFSLDGATNRQVEVKSNRWRKVVVEFAQFGRELEIKSNFKKGCVKIRKIKILPRRYMSGGGNWDYSCNPNDASYLVMQLKDAVYYLQFSVAGVNRRLLDEFNVILGKTLSVLESSSDISSDTRDAIVSLVAFMNRTDIDALMGQVLQVPTTSDIGREMLSARRVLSKMVE